MDYKKLTSVKEDLENDYSYAKNKVQELEDTVKNHPAKFEIKGDLNQQRDNIINDINSVDKKITSLKEDNTFILENLKNKNISNDRVLTFLKKENTIQRNPIKKFFRIPKNPKELRKKDIAALTKRLDEIYIPLIQKNEIKKDRLINQSFFINHSINLQEQKNKLKDIKSELELTNNKLGTKQNQIKSVLDSVIDLDFEKAKEKIKDSKISFKDVLSFIKQLISGKETEIIVDPLYKKKLKDLEKKIETTREVKIEEKGKVIINEKDLAKEIDSHLKTMPKNAIKVDFLKDYDAKIVRGSIAASINQDREYSDFIEAQYHSTYGEEKAGLGKTLEQVKEKIEKLEILKTQFSNVLEEKVNLDLNNNGIEDRFENDLNKNGIEDRFENDLNNNGIDDNLEIDKQIEEKKEAIKSVTGTEYEHNTYRLHEEIEALEALKNQNIETQIAPINVINDVLNTQEDKINIEKLPLKDFEKLGISENDLYKKLSPQDISELLKMGKTELLTLEIKKDGISFDVDAKLSLMKNKDNSVSLRVHPYRKEIENSYNLTKEELKTLKAGKIVQKDIVLVGKNEKVLYQLDKEINEIVKHNKAELQKNIDLKVPLSKEQKELISKGRTITIKGPNGKKGFDVKLNLNKKKGYSVSKRDFNKENKIEKTKQKERSL
ncbi:DUF4099 domain-containing protein [Tenacibaculum maritimum]|uniref:DUF4099 domain-containing protein n=1 Tax=Tenacibaculum maritimum TaxID=107401 RepID=UPI003875CB83